MRRRRFVAVALAVSVASPLARGADPGTPSTVVRVSGFVAEPREFDVDGLRRLPSAEVVIDGSRTYRGALLREILTVTKPTETGRYDLRRSIVVARATDGYIAVFSWAELFLSSIGDGVLVAWELNGSPLSDAEGRFALVSGRDTRPGPRHVKWLESIELRRVQP